MKILMTFLILGGAATGMILQDPEPGTQEPVRVTRGQETFQVQQPIRGQDPFGRSNGVPRVGAPHAPSPFASSPQEPAPPIAQIPGTMDPDNQFATALTLAPRFFVQHNSKAQREAERVLSKAAAKLRAAESSSEKTEATADVREALGEVYDERINSYRDHLDSLRKKITEMEEKLEKRVDARDDMVDLRLKMMVHEADGLGWPGRTPPGFDRTWFSGGGPFGPSMHGGPKPVIVYPNSDAPSNTTETWGDKFDREDAKTGPNQVSGDGEIDVEAGTPDRRRK